MPQEPRHRYHTDVPVTARRVRQTRERKPSIPSFKSKTRKTVGPAAPPPVLVRNQRTGAPVRDRVGGKHRRRMDLTLGVPGAEIRLPALPEIRVGWRILSFLLVIAFGGLLAYLWTSPTFIVQAAGVSGSDRVSAEEVNTVIGVAGSSIFSVDSSQIYTSVLTSFPEVSAITVEIKLPATISITVAEREPVITWQVGDKTLQVDKEGMAWYPRLEVPGLLVVRSESPLPEALITGTKAAFLLDPKDVQGILAMKGEIPEGAPLLFDMEHGIGWEDSRGWKVYFGFDLSQMEEKLTMYEEIIDDLKQDGVQPRFVSVEFIHAPYYRAEQPKPEP